MSTRRRLWIVALVLALTVPVDALIVRALSYPTITDRARAWAEGASYQEKMQHLRSGTLPRAYERALKESFTPDEWASVFREKIATYRQTHSTLSREQQDFLTQALKLLDTGQLYSAGSVSREEKIILAARARRLFSAPEEYGSLFLFERRADPVAKGREPGLLNELTAWLLRVVPSSSLRADDEEEGGTCTCSQADDWCEWWWQAGGHCCDGIACDPSQPDFEHGGWVPPCGFMNAFACDGKCTGSLN